MALFAVKLSPEGHGRGLFESRDAFFANAVLEAGTTDRSGMFSDGHQYDIRL
jgi:hypothetical protein